MAKRKTAKRSRKFGSHTTTHANRGAEERQNLTRHIREAEESAKKGLCLLALDQVFAAHAALGAAEAHGNSMPKRVSLSSAAHDLNKVKSRVIACLVK